MRREFTVDQWTYTIESGSTLGTYSPHFGYEVQKDTRFPAYKIVKEDDFGSDAYIGYAGEFPCVVKNERTGFPVFTTEVYYSYRKATVESFIPGPDSAEGHKLAAEAVERYRREMADMQFNAKAKIVRAGGSKIFNDWHERAGVSMEEFIDGLRWLCDDPLTEGRMRRQLGCVSMDSRSATPGLHHLKRLYRPDGDFGGFFDEDADQPWEYSNTHASISTQDRV